MIAGSSFAPIAPGFFSSICLFLHLTAMSMCLVNQFRIMLMLLVTPKLKDFKSHSRSLSRTITKSLGSRSSELSASITALKVLTVALVFTSDVAG